jgi:hypothetical protein
MYGAHMNRNMKNLIVSENILSYLYMFHMCFKQIKYMSRKYKPVKKNTTTIAKSWQRSL